MKDLQTGKDSDIVRNFELAVLLVKSLPQKGSFQPSYSEAAKIYSFFKQSKFGSCNIPRPGFWDYINRAKWDAWSALGDMQQKEAMQNYVSEIKNIYVKVKESDEFQEREHEFADILIPFCQANSITLSEKLVEIVKERNMKYNKDKEDISSSVDIHECAESAVVVQKNGHHPELNGENGMITDDESSTEKATHKNDHDHSILVENSMASTKTVKFDLNNDNDTENGEILPNLNGNGDHKSSEDEDDVYCDPIDPAQFPQNGDLRSVTESSMLTTDSGTPLIEKIPNINKSSVRKRTDIVESSSDSQDSGLVKELQKPHNRNRHRHSVKKMNAFHKTKVRQHAIRSHKRLDDHNKSKENNQQSNSNGNHRTHSNQSPRSSNISQNTRSTHISQGNDPPSDRSDSSETYSSSGSYSNDTIGLKIVNSLERMEDNMQHIIDRLDSIEETIKVVTKPVKPWWKQYMPSKTVLIWTVWPVVVNVLFYLYWRRFYKKKLKKC